MSNPQRLQEKTVIYMIANTKGGVGKTTIAVSLAAWLASHERRVLLIDTDKQASAASWASWRRDQSVDYHPRTVMLRNDSVYKEGKTLAAEHDDLVIDAGGEDNSGMRYGMLIAERLIVPVTHSNFSTAAWDDMQKIVEAARINNPALRVRVLLNRIHSSRRKPIDLEAFMTERGYEMYRTRIPELAGFVYAGDEGLAVFERKEWANAAEHLVKFLEEATHG